MACIYLINVQHVNPKQNKFYDSGHTFVQSARAVKWAKYFNSLKCKIPNGKKKCPSLLIRSVGGCSVYGYGRVRRPTLEPPLTRTSPKGLYSFVRPRGENFVSSMCAEKPKKL